MYKTTVEPVSDHEFARQVGISANLTPQLSLGRKLLLAAALLLAASTTLFAALFHRGTATNGNTLQTGVTQCPMTRNPSTPTR